MRLTEEQNDALAEVVNIGVGRAAASLGDLIDERIDLSVPCVTVCALNDLGRHIEARGESLDTLVVQGFDGGLTGRAILAFPRSSGIKLGEVFAQLDESPGKLDLDLSDILEEVGNIVLNGVLGSIANLLSTDLSYSVPQFRTDIDVARLIALNTADNEKADRTVLVANTEFGVASRNISGTLLCVFDVGSLDTVLDAVLTHGASQ